MNITIKDTGSAKNEAETIIGCYNKIDSCVGTMSYLRKQLPNMWNGEQADIADILTKLDSSITYYETKIMPALEKLGSSILAYATATEVLANKGNNMSPSEYVLSNSIKTNAADKIEITNGSKLNLTYYYPNDDCNSGTKTGSGFTTEHFNTNENGWYTKTIEKSNGTTDEYVVLAGPTNYDSMIEQFGSIEGKEYFRYGDIVNFSSNGKNYQGVVLDSCGNAMRTNTTQFDIFSSSASSTNPTTFGGVERYEKIGHVSWNYASLGTLEE